MGTEILHVSDTHLGKRQYGSEIRASDFARAFDTAVDIAIENDVDAVIHTGDLFDDRNPNTNAISQAFSSIKRLDSADIPFLGIVGNHERKWDNQWMDIFETLDNVYRLDSNPFIVNDSVAVYGFDSFRDVEWEQAEFEVTPPEEDNIPTVLCMHELFVELVPPMKAKRSLEPVLDQLNITPDAVALGDYHAPAHEDVNGVPVFYAGATERTSTTDEDPTVRILRFEDEELSEYPRRKLEGVRDMVPRPFEPVTMNLREDSGRSDIREKITSEVGDYIEDSVVVLNLEGSTDSPVSPSDAYAVMESLDIAVPYVSDKRTPETLEFDSVDAADPTTIDIEGMIDDELDDVSDTVRKIDKDIVRDLTVNKTDIRPLVEEEFNMVRGENNED